jgi:hypothetical protein
MGSEYLRLLLAIDFLPFLLELLHALDPGLMAPAEQRGGVDVRVRVVLVVRNLNKDDAFY